MNPRLTSLVSSRVLSAVFTVLFLAGAASLRADIHEYEGFDYPTGSAVHGLNGGTGWGGNIWTNTDTHATIASDGASLTFSPTVGHLPAGSRILFDSTAGGRAERRVGTTLPLNVEGATYYVSALIKRQGGFKFEFLDNGINVRWRFGALGEGTTNTAVLGVAGDTLVNNVFPLNETVLMVAKIRTRAVSDASNPDLTYLNVYRAGDIVPVNEPAIWQANGPTSGTAAYSGVTLTRLAIRNISALPLEVDEIRIGTNWLEVTGAVAPQTAPVITRQPTAGGSPISTYQGLNVQLFVEATGQEPLSYQWLHDGSPVTDATNAVLLLTNLQPAQAGSYVVHITNNLGFADSDPVLIEVLQITNTSVGLVGLWHFDETTGLTAYDATANQFNGSLSNYPAGDAQWIPSDYGGSLAFYGSNFVEVAHAPKMAVFANRFSVAAWVRPSVFISTNGNFYRCLEKENMFFLLQGNGNNVDGVGNGGMNLLVKKNAINVPVSIFQALEANAWYHLAATYDGASLKMYLDGQLKDTKSVAAPIDSTSLPLHIGSDYATSGVKYFNGRMDEVGLWDRALGASEVLELAGQSGAPVILEQPAAVSRYAGSTVTFQVRARGAAPLRYLWFKGTTEIRSATSNVFTVANIQAGDAGDYRCRVSNDAGETFSEYATLTVVPVTSITDAQQTHWRFDDGSGYVAADSSAHGQDGALVDYLAPDGQWMSGQVNGALAFDGVSNRVVISNSAPLNISPDATFAFWIYPTNYGMLRNAGSYFNRFSRIMRKAGQFDIELVDDPGSVRATLRANGVPAPQQNIVALNEWQHFAIVYSGGMVSFYKNGFMVGTPIPGSLGASNGNLIVLGNIWETVNGTNDYMFAGAMDEVGIWTRLLGETEILTLAGRDVTGPPVIVTQPQAASRYVGSSVSFSVEATGQRPLTYQWLRNGTPIPDSNTNILTLPNLTLAAAGNYTVSVQNGQGSTVSAPAAVLTVVEVAGITTGLIAYWKFDDTNGTTLADASGHGHSAELQNATAVPGTVGMIGGAFAFDGANDFAVVPNAAELNLDGQATISVWINPRTLAVTGDRMRIVRKDINFDLTLYSAGSRLLVYGVNKAQYYAPNNSVTVNEWQHIAVVIKDGTLQFFRNGRALAEPMPGLLGPACTNDLVIGNFSASDPTIPRYFNGFMDDLGIWDRALTASELDGIYQNGLVGRSLNEPFVPFHIQSINFPTESQVRLTFSSPYTGRPHLLQHNTQLATNGWVDQTPVTFTDLGGGLLEALFAKPADSTAFYRIALGAQADIFFENFETGGPGWAHGGAGDNWEVGVPLNGPAAAVSGTNVAATDLDGNLLPYTDSYLRSPVINLTGISRATLSFQQWRNVDPDPVFHATIVNALDADSLTVLQELFRASGTTSGYELRSLPLSPTVLGRRIILEFRVYCDAYNLLEGWYIDDVRIAPE